MRADVRINCLPLLSWKGETWTPGNEFAYVFDSRSGEHALSLIDPDNYEEGTLFFAKNVDYPFGIIYVVVFDPITLSKKMVIASHSAFYNSATSKPFDPLAVFYDPLAS